MRCHKCGKFYDRTELTLVPGKFMYCKNCLPCEGSITCGAAHTCSEYLMLCSSCHGLACDEHRDVAQDGRIFCTVCGAEELGRCHECGELVPEKEMVKNEIEEYRCQKCAEFQA